MTPAILICDDSNLARKQLARILPQEWQPAVYFAGHGADAMVTIKQHAIDWLFLDLNMPVMDGYQVLTELKRLGLSLQVVVVSGDIQPEAYERVMALGAKAFLKKPVSAPELAALLKTEVPVSAADKKLQRTYVAPEKVQLDAELRDVFQEVANVAMG